MPDYGHQEMVVFINAENKVKAELRFAQFERCLDGEREVPGFSAETVRCVYCVIGRDLAVEGLVYFLLEVDEEGRVSPSFNLPLRYLVQQAGIGADLGKGGIRKASRGQCPIPWHAVHLWEPESADMHAKVQKIVARNKLNLKPVDELAPNLFTEVGIEPLHETLHETLDETLEIYDTLEIGSLAENSVARDLHATQPSVHHPSQHPSQHSAQTELQEKQLYEKLEALLSQEGGAAMGDMMRLHSEQLQTARMQYRDDLEKQQTTYLDQLRTARDQIHELKVALRQEQSRNRRLQQMLRGDP